MAVAGRTRDRLAGEADLYKKAWVVAACWVGYKGPIEDLAVPDYRQWNRRQLTDHVAQLKEDFANEVDAIVDVQGGASLDQLARFLASFHESAAKGDRPFKICMAIEFERRFGPQRIARHVEVPPYAELLFQGIHGVAIRHPEYMLARDLQFLYGLFWQAERLLAGQNWLSPPQWARSASENVQALGRATIQACFALLESFVSGLARAHIMTSDSLSAEERDKLLDGGRPLKQRLLSVPRLITGREPSLDVNKAPMSRLFGEIKERRDSFVHCEPGEEAGHRGYVKEERFHDVAPQVIDDAVALTTQVIEAIWKDVTGREDGPRWLPDLAADKQTKAADLVLAPPTDPVRPN